MEASGSLRVGGAEGVGAGADFAGGGAAAHAASIKSAARMAAAWRGSEIRIVEGAGHSLYDPGVRDAVMKAIADMASVIKR